MKRKVVLVVLLAGLCSVLPCFAKVVSKKGSYKIVNIEEFWHDELMTFSSNVASESAESVYNSLQKDGYLKNLSNFWGKAYWTTADEYYFVSLYAFKDGYGGVLEVHFYPMDEYCECLSKNVYQNYNEAKSRFDWLCDKYYEKMFE